MRKSEGATTKVRAFDHPVLERLSRIHPAIPLLFWGPVALLLLIFGLLSGLSPVAAALWTAGGVLSWSLTEYLLHRFVFHFEPRHPTFRRRYYPVHRLHHDVQEWDRLVAPPLLSVPLALLFYGAFRLLLGWPAVLPFFAGFVAGYLAYDYVHLFTHFARPRTAIGRGLRRRHLQHHFAYPDRWFGVSSPLWDYVFRTHVARGGLAQRRVVAAPNPPQGGAKLVERKGAESARR